MEIATETHGALPKLERRTLLDEATLEAAYRTRFAALLRVSIAITGDPDIAREAVQEGTARAVAARHAYRAAGSVEGWLFACVVNAARNARRSEARRLPPAVAAPATADGESAGDDTTGEAVRRLVATLPERQRLAVFLRYYADLEYDVIAAVLGVRRGTVSALLHHAHQALRRALARTQVTP